MRPAERMYAQANTRIARQLPASGFSTLSPLQWRKLEPPAVHTVGCLVPRVINLKWPVNSCRLQPSSHLKCQVDCANTVRPFLFRRRPVGSAGILSIELRNSKQASRVDDRLVAYLTYCCQQCRLLSRIF